MPENEAVIEKQYEMFGRNKWLTANATSLDEMIDHLQQAVAELRAMRAAGVTLAEHSAMGDDYAELVTTDPKVAKKFGFQERDWGDEEEEFCEDDSDAEEAQAAKSKKAKQAKAKK
jgi:hypothetical protein